MLHAHDMDPSHAEAYLAVLDLDARVFRRAILINLPLEQLRAALSRQPDVDDGRMVSWGRLDDREVACLVARLQSFWGESIEEQEFAPFMVGSQSECRTLYFTDGSHGE